MPQNMKIPAAKAAVDKEWEKLENISCVEPDESQEKEKIHYSTTLLVHKFIPMPQAMKIPAAKAAVDKEWEKLEKISAWNLTKVRKRRKFITALQFGSQIYSYASSYEKFLQQKQRWTRHGKNWRKFRLGT